MYSVHVHYCFFFKGFFADTNIIHISYSLICSSSVFEVEHVNYITEEIVCHSISEIEITCYCTIFRKWNPTALVNT